MRFPGGGCGSGSITSGLHVSRGVERACGRAGTGWLMEERVDQSNEKFEEIGIGSSDASH